MTYEEKFAAINALTPASLLMRKPEDWYVSQHVEMKDGGILSGRSGNGETPQEAINAHWCKLTMLQPTQYLLLNAAGPSRRAVR